MIGSEWLLQGYSWDLALRTERALLASVLITGVKQRSDPPVKVTDFSTPAHRLLWGAICEMAKDGLAIDVITVEHKLGEHGMKIVGMAYLSGLLDAAPDVSNMDEYAAFVREGAIERRLAEMTRTSK